MAHNNDYTHIYIDKSVTPNVGIDFDEVRKALNESTLDCGKLCTSNKINVWARYRPMLMLNDPSLILKDQTVVGEGSHGQTITTQNDLDIFIVPEPATGYAQWESFRGPIPDPELGAYRIVDFDGYRHDAPCPFSSLNLPTSHQLGQKDTDANAGEIRVSISIDVNAQRNQGSVLLSDFTILKSPSNYLGFVFCKRDGFFSYDRKCIVTSASPISAAGTSPILLYVDAPDGKLSAGTWDCYPVLVVGRSFPAGAAQSEIDSITFYTLPLNREQISIVAAPQYSIEFPSASVTYNANNSTLQVSFTVIMYNIGSYTGTESYKIYGIQDDDTTVDLLYKDEEGPDWPLVPSDGSGNKTRTWIKSNINNQYEVYRPGTADPVYLQYKTIQIVYSRGSHSNSCDIDRGNS